MNYLYFYYLNILEKLNIPIWIAIPVWYIIPFAIVTIMLIISVIILVLAERKILAYFTLRKGPNRVGLYGCLQTIADAIKLLFKEDIIPKNADKILFNLAPIIAFVPIMILWGLIPYNNNFKIINSNVGVLLYLAIMSYPVLGIILAGYASNNKYSLIGAFRGVALAISYELPMLMSVLSIVILSGTMNLADIVNSQSSVFGFLSWYFIPAFIGCIIFYLTMLAELNRTPFDFSEAESELVSGYNTEYSGMKFALFFLGEYAALFILAMFMSVLFFGGYLSPLGFFITEKIADLYHLNVLFTNILVYIEQLFWLLIKTIGIILSIIWIRATLPRFKLETLMSFSWKVLLPLSILNFFIVCLFSILGGI